MKAGVTSEKNYNSIPIFFEVSLVVLRDTIERRGIIFAARFLFPRSSRRGVLAWTSGSCNRREESIRPFFLLVHRGSPRCGTVASSNHEAGTRTGVSQNLTQKTVTLHTSNTDNASRGGEVISDMQIFCSTLKAGRRLDVSDGRSFAR